MSSLFRGVPRPSAELAKARRMGKRPAEILTQAGAMVGGQSIELDLDAAAFKRFAPAFYALRRRQPGLKEFVLTRTRDGGFALTKHDQRD